MSIAGLNGALAAIPALRRILKDASRTVHQLMSISKPNLFSSPPRINGVRLLANERLTLLILKILLHVVYIAEVLPRVLCILLKM